MSSTRNATWWTVLTYVRRSLILLSSYTCPTSAVVGQLERTMDPAGVVLRENFGGRLRRHLPNQIVAGFELFRCVGPHDGCARVDQSLVHLDEGPRELLVSFEGGRVVRFGRDLAGQDVGADQRHARSLTRPE